MKGISIIEIKHFKGLFGSYKIDLSNSCSNLLLYGENGSGKSSICEALKLFFEAASDSSKTFKNNEHKFLTGSDINSGYIQISFVKDDGSLDIPEILSCDNTKRPSKTYIKETNKLKAFLGYKDLLETHYVKEDSINVFSLLVENILFFFPNSFNGNKPLGKEWIELSVLFKEYLANKKKHKSKFTKALKLFNQGVQYALSETKAKSNELIKKFKYNLEIDFQFGQVQEDAIGNSLINQEINLKVHYHGVKNLPRHHYFLNEARLTAIGISIFLASVLKIPSLDKYKILVLDDIFVGLDTANRIPLLNIFEEFFSEYQIIMATYDRHWYSVAKKWLSNKNQKWKAYELYSNYENHKYGQPELVESSNPLSKALKHFKTSSPDYPAAANYLRKAAENSLKNFLPDYFMKTKEGLNYVNLNNLINKSIELFRLIEYPIDDLVKLRQYKDMLMNPMSHYNIDYPVYRSDLLGTIEIIKSLKNLPNGTDFEIVKVLDTNSRIRLYLEVRNKGSLEKYAFEGSTAGEIFFYRKCDVNEIINSNKHFKGNARYFIGKVKLTTIIDLLNSKDRRPLNKEGYLKAISSDIKNFQLKSGKTFLKSNYQLWDNGCWRNLVDINDNYWDDNL